MSILSERADVAILGGGPGGQLAALWAAQRAAGPVLAAKEGLGGTCRNRENPNVSARSQTVLWDNVSFNPPCRSRQTDVGEGVLVRVEADRRDVRVGSQDCGQYGAVGRLPGMSRIRGLLQARPGEGGLGGGDRGVTAASVARPSVRLISSYCSLVISPWAYRRLAISRGVSPPRVWLPRPQGVQAPPPHIRPQRNIPMTQKRIIIRGSSHSPPVQDGNQPSQYEGKAIASSSAVRSVAVAGPPARLGRKRAGAGIIASQGRGGNRPGGAGFGEGGENGQRKMGLTAHAHFAKLASVFGR